MPEDSRRPSAAFHLGYAQGRDEGLAQARDLLRWAVEPIFQRLKREILDEGVDTPKVTEVEWRLLCARFEEAISDDRSQTRFLGHYLEVISE